MKSRHSGFTLFELLVALAMVGILVGLAAPSFRDFGRNTRVVTTHNDLITAFGYARNEAIRRGRPVTVCSTSNYKECADDGWASGWLVFSDTLGTGQGSVGNTSAGEEILQIWRGPGAENVEMAQTGTNAEWLTFTQTGLVNPTTITKTYQLHSVSCPGGAMQKRRITVSPIGSVRTEKLACP